MRRSLSWILMLLLASQGLAPLCRADDPSATVTQAEVTASSLNMRSGPSTNDPVVRSLPRGTVVALLEEQDGWARLRLPDGTEGWAAIKYLAAVSPVAPAERALPAPGTKETVRDGARDTSADRDAGSRGSGSSSLRSIAKWGSLGAGLVCWGLAFMKKSSADDAYQEYEDLHAKGDYGAADAKFDEVSDHDSQTEIFAMVGGAFVGLFLLQQFVLTGGGDDDGSPDQALHPDHPVRFEAGCAPGYDPATRGVRVDLLRIRF